MVRESLANAARHGGAAHVEVEIAAAGDGLAVRVTDDGRGFPFSGRYDLAELERRDMGPRTMRARIAALGGDLVIESSNQGSRLEMKLPRQRTAA